MKRSAEVKSKEDSRYSKDLKSTDSTHWLEEEILGKFFSYNFQLTKLPYQNHIP